MLAVEEVKLLSLTLGKNVLQIQVEVFHAVATTAEKEKTARIISLY